jgi:predicted nucleic acid-binding Zn ribbon protein
MKNCLVCGKEITDNLKFCSKDCVEKAKERAESKEKTEIEKVLEFIGVTHDNARTDAYNHWKRFIEFGKQNSGKDWKEEIRPKLRSWIAVDFRYIDDYLNTCLVWNIFSLHNGMLVFEGIPKEQV